MTIAVDLGHKATKQTKTNKTIKVTFYHNIHSLPFYTSTTVFHPM